MTHTKDPVTHTTQPDEPSALRVVRVDAVPLHGTGPRKVYLLETPEPTSRVREVAAPLLADGIRDAAEVHDAPFDPPAGMAWVEVQPKPGVTDPAAATVHDTLVRRGLDVRAVRTGRAWAVAPENAAALAASAANGVIERVLRRPDVPACLEHAPEHAFELRHVPLAGLDDAGLTDLSRRGHLFLSVSEMRAIQAFFATLRRDPTDAELETLAQTWSEHCVHKTLKSAVVVRDAQGRELRHYGNLIRDTIFASTRTLIARRDDGFCLSVFTDNAGVIAFDDDDGVCFKVETHNRPSAIEPYGGAATGAGGVIRDVLGTGLGARPVANTDVFCVATDDASVPEGVIPPDRVLAGVAAGVRDYGNRMGIPTVNGAVVYHDGYVANPLVFCGCVGILPRDKVDKAARPGDRVVVMGGRTGRDGIHGATFSSAQLTDDAGGEFGHAVQIGDAITEKKVLDVLLEARDRNLFTAVTDCGAGGLSSAVGEMGEHIGARVELARVPLKYAGLRYDEVWISEAQERMVLAVPPERLDALLALAGSRDVEATDIGVFGEGDSPELVLTWDGTQVARLPMAFLHDGLPMPTREATLPAEVQSDLPRFETSGRPADALLRVLADPNVASKHRIVRQYDHEVQGNTLVKPFVGPLQIGPADAAVIRPKPGSDRGVAVSCGLAPHLADPYQMTLAAIDEAVRNAVCVGVDPTRLALLDNFCWPGTDTPEAMGTLVRACEACRDVALVWQTPFVSGKDSLHNQFTDRRTGRTVRIPPTLLASAFGIVEDVTRCVTSDLKTPGETLWLVGPASDTPDLEARWRVHLAVSTAVRSGCVSATHDVSDGGWLAAVAEMAIGGDLGVRLAASAPEAFFAEPMTTYVLAGTPPQADADLAVVALGEVAAEPVLTLPDGETVAVSDLRRAWRHEA